MITPHAIETQNLTRRFGRLEAVRGLNLQVPAGSTFATRCAARLLPPGHRLSAYGQVIPFLDTLGHRDEELAARTPPVVVDRAWLDGADFVIVRATYDGSIRRTLEIPDVPLQPTPDMPPVR